MSACPCGGRIDCGGQCFRECDEPSAENPCFHCDEEIGDADQVMVRGLTGRIFAAHASCAGVAS